MPTVRTLPPVVGVFYHIIYRYDTREMRDAARVMLAMVFWYLIASQIGRAAWAFRGWHLTLPS